MGGKTYLQGKRDPATHRRETIKMLDEWRKNTVVKPIALPSSESEEEEVSSDEEDGPKLSSDDEYDPDWMNAKLAFKKTDIGKSAGKWALSDYVVTDTKDEPNRRSDMSQSQQVADRMNGLDKYGKRAQGLRIDRTYSSKGSSRKEFRGPR